MSISANYIVLKVGALQAEELNCSEAFHNKLPVLLLFEYSTFCTALFLGFQIASIKAVDDDFL